MRAFIQRVSSAGVSIEGKTVSSIGAGFLILFGVREGDSKREADVLAEKIVNLRIMNDENKKMNVSVKESRGSILVVSQFTLYADISGGRRPSFVRAAKPEVARELYTYFVDKLRLLGIKDIQTGEFGAYMSVKLENDGPVTLLLDSDEMITKK